MEATAPARRCDIALFGSTAGKTAVAASAAALGREAAEVKEKKPELAEMGFANSSGAPRSLYVPATSDDDTKPL